MPTSGDVTDAAAFAVKDCALVALATGRKSRLLQDFRGELARIPAASIYHHFWGGLLQPRFEEREYNNDFAAWVRGAVHELVLAERLAALSPVDYPDLEALRRALLDLVDTRLDETEHLIWAPASEAFEFVRSQIVVFDTEHSLEHPRDLAVALPELSTSSIFYHFIDARRRTEGGHDDFSDWLCAYGAEFSSLRDRLANVDPYFGSLAELRDELAGLFAEQFPGGAA